MGSSKGGGGNPNTPSGFPIGPGGGPPPPGIAAPYHPAFQSFLPTTAGQVATGLTQDMMNQIDTPPPTRQAPVQDTNALMDMLAKMMASQRGYVPPRDTNPGSAFSPFSASSNSGGGYQSMRSGPMLNRGGR